VLLDIKHSTFQSSPRKIITIKQPTASSLDPIFSHYIKMSPPRRAIIAITSAKAELFEGGGHTTGVFIGEALHPFNVLTAAGFEVDLASEKGEYTEDWLSLQPGFLTEEERKQYDDKSSAFRRKLDSGLKASDVDASKYGVFYASAGHAALIDYPHAKGLKQVASSIYEAGGIVSTVYVSLFPSNPLEQY
jgi:hypothetical protein